MDFFVAALMCNEVDVILVDTLVCFESCLVIFIIELLREENCDALAMVFLSLL
jgi:hypothetical protein